MRMRRTWRGAGLLRWRLWFAMPMRPAPAVAVPATCRWFRCRRARSSGWRGGMRGSRTCCRCRRCRRGCCSMRCMTRRRPTSTACSCGSPWGGLDLAGLDGVGRERRLAEVLAQERAARFDLSCPPLLRFALLRLSAVEHRLVLCSHHLVSDGWSTPVLVQELLTLYAHKGDGGALARVTPYRDYLAWLSRQDRAAALAACQEPLRGLEEPPHVAAPRSPPAPRQPHPP